MLTGQINQKLIIAASDLNGVVGEVLLVYDGLCA